MEFPYHGLTLNGQGIKSEERVFLMFPAARRDGSRIEPLPLIGPYEILRVTSRTPDLTRQHPETVKEDFEKRLAYYQHVTREQHLKKYSQDDWITGEEFEKARARILAQPLEDFATTVRARDAVWHKHGTKELARHYGYLDFVDQMMIQQAFRRHGMSEEQAWKAVSTVNYIAIYDDPQKTKLYLLDLKDEPIMAGDAHQAKWESAMMTKIDDLNTKVDLTIGSGTELASEVKNLRAATILALEQAHEKMDAHDVKTTTQSERIEKQVETHRDEDSAAHRAVREDLSTLKNLVPAQEQKEIIPEPEVARVFRLYGDLMAMGTNLKASPARVFDLMVMKKLTRAETAVECKCARSLITKRVAVIAKHFHMPIEKLLALASVLKEREATVKGDPYAKKKQGALPDDDDGSNVDEDDGGDRLEESSDDH